MDAAALFCAVFLCCGAMSIRMCKAAVPETLSFKENANRMLALKLCAFHTPREHLPKRPGTAIESPTKQSGTATESLASKTGCIMYCFSAGFRNFVRGECHANERILQIEKESPVTPELRSSNLVENARCMSLRMCFRDFATRSDLKKGKKSAKMCRSKQESLEIPCRFFKKGKKAVHYASLENPGKPRDMAGETND